MAGVEVRMSYNGEKGDAGLPGATKTKPACLTVAAALDELVTEIREVQWRSDESDAAAEQRMAAATEAKAPDPNFEKWKRHERANTPRAPRSALNQALDEVLDTGVVVVLRPVEAEQIAAMLQAYAVLGQLAHPERCLAERLAAKLDSPFARASRELDHEHFRALLARAEERASELARSLLLCQRWAVGFLALAFVFASLWVLK